MNEDKIDFETMMRIFRKLGVRKGFFGEFLFVFSDGNFVQMVPKRVRKPDEVKEILNA